MFTNNIFILNNMWCTSPVGKGADALAVEEVVFKLPNVHVPILERPLPFTGLQSGPIPVLPPRGPHTMSPSCTANSSVGAMQPHCTLEE